MGLTPAEENELAQLEKENQMASAPAQPQASNLSPQEEAELSQLEAMDNHLKQNDLNAQNRAAQMNQANEQARQQQALLEGAPEANLGVVNRAKYALEPIESNRKALLIQQFGPENVLEDSKGNSYIKQDGQIKPVNTKGFSTADVAEIAGTIPEALGGTAGGIFGGGVPGAIAGGALGSGIRQAASAMIGTPQVATPLERATEAGMSAGLNAIGFKVAQGVGGAIKAVAEKVAPLIGKTTEDVTKAARIEQLFKENNLGKPTLGQKLGDSGFVSSREKQLAETPFFGRKLRKTFEDQGKAVVSALKNEVGDFTDPNISLTESGAGLKKIATEKVKVLKNISQKLFDSVDEVGKNVTIDGETAAMELINKGMKGRLFDAGGNPLEYSARSGLDKESFNKIQDVLGGVIKDLKQSSAEGAGALLGEGRPMRGVSVKEVDLIRRAISKEADAARGTNAGRYLSALENDFLDVVGKGLDAGSPGASRNFKAARAQWAEFRNTEEAVRKLGLDLNKPGSLADEHVLKRMFNDTQKLRAFKNIVGEENVKASGTKLLRDEITTNLVDNQISAARLSNLIKAKKAPLEEAFGKEQVSKLVRLLDVDKNLKIRINPSGTDFSRALASPKETIARGLYNQGVLAILNGAVSIPGRTVRQGVRAGGQELKRDSVYGVRKMQFSDQNSEQYRTPAKGKR